MKKKIMMIALMLMMSVASYAQFEKGKMFASASLSGLDFNYNSNDKWKLDLTMKGGYMFEDSWMLYGQAEYYYRKNVPNYFLLGAGMRYYIVQNGLYLGLGANYVHQTDKENETVDDIMPGIQIGYAFFLSRTVTIEPEVYYNQSLKNHSQFSGMGLRLGFGIYL